MLSHFYAGEQLDPAEVGDMRPPLMADPILRWNDVARVYNTLPVNEDCRRVLSPANEADRLEVAGVLADQDLTYQYDGYTFTVLSDTAQIDQPGVGIVAATTVQAFQDCDRIED